MSAIFGFTFCPVGERITHTQLTALDRLVHVCWNKLFMAWWTNRLEQCCWNHHDKSMALIVHVIHDRTCCLRVHFVREWWNNKIEQRCYNNHKLGCCIKSGFACSNIREQPLLIRQAVTICWNMIEQYCYLTNPVLSCWQWCYRVVEPTPL